MILKPIDFKATESDIWIWNHLNLTALESQVIMWISNHLNTWIPNQWLTIKSLDIRTNWQPNRSTPQSTDNQSIWISNHLNLKVVESQISWSSNELTTKTLNLKSMEFPSSWISNRPNVKSIESQTKWHAKQLNLKSIDFRTNWIPHLLPIGALSLETSATASCGRYICQICQIYQTYICIYIYMYTLPKSALTPQPRIFQTNLGLIFSVRPGELRMQLFSASLMKSSHKNSENSLAWHLGSAHIQLFFGLMFPGKCLILNGCCTC